MMWRLDRASDRWAGHDYPGVVGSGFAVFVLDEIELGGRAAYLLGDPDQAWWEVHAEQIRADLEREPMADAIDRGWDCGHVRRRDLGR